MKVCATVEVQLLVFFTSPLGEREWSGSRTGCFIPG